MEGLEFTSDHASGGTCSFPNMKADAGSPDSNLPCNAAVITDLCQILS